MKTTDYRARINAIHTVLLASLYGQQKVRADSKLILPLSDPVKDPWGYMCDSLAAQFSAFSSKIRLDANETLLFSTQLKFVVKEFLRTLYIPNVVRTWGINVNRNYPPGAVEVAMRRITRHGEMKPLSPTGDDTKGTTLTAEELTWRAEGFGEYFAWTLDELERSLLAGVSLPTEGMAALSELAELMFEKMALFGDTKAGIYGLYTEPLIDTVSVVTGLWTTGPATTDQVLADCRKALYAARAGTASNFIPNIMVVPESRWEFMGSRRANTDTTIKTMLEEEFPGIKITPSVRGDASDALGTGPRLLVGNTSPAVCEIHELLPFSPETPEKHGFEWRVYARIRLGGVAFKHPKAWKNMDGI